MFCQSIFITNEIFAFLNASIGWTKQNCCYINNFNTSPIKFDCVCLLLSYSFNFATFLPHAGSWHVGRLGPKNFILGSILFSQQFYVSIHFQFCFQYIIPHFTMLCLQMLSLAMGSYFPVVHPSQP